MEYVTKKRLKAGLCIAVIAGVMAPLPMISQQAAKTRLDVTKQSVAADFLAGSLPAQPKLLSLSAQIQALPAAVRDAAIISDIPVLDAGLIRAAGDATAQKQCMAEAIYYEARSETFAGQKAVGEVVLNRIGSKHFPNTVCGVVYQGAERKTGCQFSFTCDGSMDTAPAGKAWLRSQVMAEYMLTGVHKPMTARATHYHTTDVNPKWAGSVQPTHQIGSHKFYRFKTRREQALTRVAAP